MIDSKCLVYYLISATDEHWTFAHTFRLGSYSCIIRLDLYHACFAWTVFLLSIWSNQMIPHVYGDIFSLGCHHCNNNSFACFLECNFRYWAKHERFRNSYSNFNNLYSQFSLTHNLHLILINSPWRSLALYK